MHVADDVLLVPSPPHQQHQQHRQEAAASPWDAGSSLSDGSDCEAEPIPVHHSPVRKRHAPNRVSPAKARRMMEPDSPSCTFCQRQGDGLYGEGKLLGPFGWCTLFTLATRKQACMLPLRLSSILQSLIRWLVFFFSFFLFF